MTRKQFCRELRRWYELFCLQEWNLTINTSPAASIDYEGREAVAILSAARGSMSATVHAALGADEEDLKDAPCHEMLHLALQGLTDAEGLALEPLSKGERDLALALLKQRREEVVLRLERAFAEIGKGQTP